MATKRDIMLKCLRQLSMVYGTSVNTYAEDKLYSMIDDALESLFKERFWQRHIRKEKVQLSSGYPIANDLNYIIREFEDVQTVMNDDSYPSELSKANYSVIADTYTGTTPLYFQYAHDQPEKLVRCIPPADGVSVWLVFRTLCKSSVYAKWKNGQTIIPATDLPFDYLPDEELPFDALALQYKACHNYMVIKGDNPEATETFRQLYLDRLQKLIKEETNDTMSYGDGAIQTYQHGWWSR